MTLADTLRAARISYNLAERVLIYNDGTVCEITNLLDSDGEETADIEAAAMVVCQMTNGQWLTIRVNEESDEPVQSMA